MRFVCAFMICILFSIVLLGGCEPEPEIFAMKTERVGADTEKTTYYTNGMLSSESISTRNNGIDDVWKFYINGVLVRIDEDLNFDGVVDKSRKFDPESGILLVTKIDEDFDGTFEIIDEYDDVYVQTDEKLQRRKENQLEEVDEMVTVAEPVQKTAVYRQTPTETVVEEINTTDELINIEPELPPARSSTIIIEDDAIPRSQQTSGSYFQPLEVNPGTGSVTPSRSSKIVPAPVFTHPSDALED